MFYAAFSPDAIAVAVNEVIFDEEGILFLVEIKSKCTPATVIKETALARTYGTCPSVYVAFTDPMNDDFKYMIPEPEYRCQLVHGIASGNLQHAFYVVGSLHKIICVAHMNVDDQQLVEHYQCALQEVHDHELSWVLHGH